MCKHAVIGSRDYAHLDDVRELIESFPPDTIVVSGGRRGVDQFAETVARERGLAVEIVPTYWNEYGRKANTICDREIARSCDRMSAFCDSSEERSAIRQAQFMRKPVKIKKCK
jgi:hypothetical protein